MLSSNTKKVQQLAEIVNDAARTKSLEEALKFLHEKRGTFIETEKLFGEEFFPKLKYWLDSNEALDLINQFQTEILYITMINRQGENKWCVPFVFPIKLSVSDLFHNDILQKSNGIITEEGERFFQRIMHGMLFNESEISFIPKEARFKFRRELVADYPKNIRGFIRQVEDTTPTFIPFEPVSDTAPEYEKKAFYHYYAIGYCEFNIGLLNLEQKARFVKATAELKKFSLKASQEKQLLHLNLGASQSNYILKGEAPTKFPNKSEKMNSAAVPLCQIYPPLFGKNAFQLQEICYIFDVAVSTKLSLLRLGEEYHSDPNQFQLSVVTGQLDLAKTIHEHNTAPVYRTWMIFFFYDTLEDRLTIFNEVPVMPEVSKVITKEGLIALFKPEINLNVIEGDPIPLKVKAYPDNKSSIVPEKLGDLKKYLNFSLVPPMTETAN